MVSKYSPEQIEQARVLAIKSRYYGERCISLAEDRDLLCIYYLFRLGYVSLRLRINFKHAYDQARYHTKNKLR